MFDILFVEIDKLVNWGVFFRVEIFFSWLLFRFNIFKLVKFLKDGKVEIWLMFNFKLYNLGEFISGVIFVIWL